MEMNIGPRGIFSKNRTFGLRISGEENTEAEEPMVEKINESLVKPNTILSLVVWNQLKQV